MFQLSEKQTHQDNERVKVSKQVRTNKGVCPTFLHCDIPSEEKLSVASGKSYPEAKYKKEIFPKNDNSKHSLLCNENWEN